MGRIKTKMIKNTARQLLAGENVFEDNFEQNKKFLHNLLPSKSVQNKVAGYIARLVRFKKTKTPVIISE